ncbi:sigma-70 family RNA polymerase sigma factor [Chromatiaceae bacterium AAb-1]|nr:sigma-70 family RNA polymerase sigma factor [Chromatiaceae bacterium AAb-1]
MNSQETAWADAMHKERLGDRAAYQRFLQEFAAYLRRIVRYRLRHLGLNPAEAEDVVQEVLVAVHSKRDQWNAERPLRPWLDAIARYKIIDTARRLRKETRGRVELSDDEWSSLVPLDQGIPEISGADIESLISELPSGEQSVVRAIGIHGASHRETAAQLGMKEGAVRVAFHRALKKLIAAARRQRQ